MKVLILLILVTIIFSCKTPQKTQVDNPIIQRENSADTAISDTTLFIKDYILKNKEKYVNQPLSKLVYDLKIPIVSYLSGRATENRAISPNTVFSFYSRTNTTALLATEGRPFLLTVIWATPLPMDDVSHLYTESKGEWLLKDNDYYLKQIVKDFYFTKKQIISN